MSEPVVGYASILTALNVTNTDALENFPASALGNGLTFDRWRVPSSLGTTVVDIDAGAAVPVDYVGIAAHNLADLPGMSISVYGGASSPAATLVATISTFSNNAPLLSLFSSATYRHWRLSFSWTTPEPADVSYVDVGALYIGARLTFERCLRGQYAPAPLNRRTDFYDNDSESGQFLGRSIMRRGFATSVSFDMMTGAWVRASFQPFVKAARLSPYFFAWNPGDYPDEIIFGRTKNDIGATYTGDRDRMQSNFEIEGLGWDD